jgi:hypothetical protein
VVDSILQNKEVKQLGYDLNPFHWAKKLFWWIAF